MVILKRRSRIVTFRVSAEEHDVLMESCVSSGARSIAEFRSRGRAAEGTDVRCARRYPQRRLNYLESRADRTGRIVD